MHQKTFVMVKPDGVERKLIGKIISTFEDASMSISRLEMIIPVHSIANQHYPSSTEWLSTSGNRAIGGLKDAGIDPLAELGTDDPLEVGKIIKQKLVNFLCSGQVVIMIVEGNLAVSNVRRLIGGTLPSQADPSTIRGKYCIDSPDASFKENRPLMNLVHASGNPSEADFEINLWFGKE